MLLWFLFDLALFGRYDNWRSPFEYFRYKKANESFLFGIDVTLSHCIEYENWTRRVEILNAFPSLVILKWVIFGEIYAIYNDS